jgi:hypothetical protein
MWGIALPRRWVAAIVRPTMVVTLPGPRLGASRLVLDHADLRWRWLPASDLRRLARNLDVPTVRSVLRPLDRPTVHERLLVLAHGDEWSGSSLTLVVEQDGEPLGLSGVVRRDGALRGSTHLHPDLERRGVAVAAGRIAAAVAELTGLRLAAAGHAGPAFGVPLDSAETEALRRLVEVTPFGQHLPDDLRLPAGA